MLNKPCNVPIIFNHFSVSWEATFYLMNRPTGNIKLYGRNIPKTRFPFTPFMCVGYKAKWALTPTPITNTSFVMHLYLYIYISMCVCVYTRATLLCR